jgi:hypothetical protein
VPDVAARDEPVAQQVPGAQGSAEFAGRNGCRGRHLFIPPTEIAATIYRFAAAATANAFALAVVRGDFALVIGDSLCLFEFDLIAHVSLLSHEILRRLPIRLPSVIRCQGCARPANLIR